MKIYDQPTALLEKLLDLRSQKNELITSNLANRDTPGFKAKDISFVDQLKKAYQPKPDMALQVSNERHITNNGQTNLQQVNGSLFNPFNPEPKYDGNTVDLDQEMSKLAENQLMFEAGIQMLNFKFRSLKYAVEEGGR